MEYEAISSVFFSKFNLMKNKLGDYQVQPFGTTSVVYTSSKSLKEAFLDWINAGIGTRSKCSSSVSYLICDVLQDQMNNNPCEIITWLCLGKTFRVKVKYANEIVASDIEQLLFFLREAVYGKKLASFQSFLSVPESLKIMKLKKDLYSLNTPTSEKLVDSVSGTTPCFPLDKSPVLPYPYLKLLDDILSEDGDGIRFEMTRSDKSKIVNFSFGNFLSYDFTLLEVPSCCSHMKLSYGFGGSNMEDFEKLVSEIDTFQVSRSPITNQNRVEITYMNRKFSTFLTAKNKFPKRLLSILDTCEYRFEKNMGKYFFVKETTGENISLPNIDIDHETYFERHDPRIKLEETSPAVFANLSIVSSSSESDDVNNDNNVPKPSLEDEQPFSESESEIKTKIKTGTKTDSGLKIEEEEIDIQKDAEDFVLTEASPSHCVICMTKEEPDNLRDYFGDKPYHFVGRENYFDYEDGGKEWIYTSTRRLNAEKRPNLVFFSCYEEYAPYKEFLEENPSIFSAIGKPILRDAVVLDLTQKNEDEVVLSEGKTHFFSTKVSTEDCYEIYVEGDSYISPGLDLKGSLSSKVIFSSCDVLRAHLGKSETIVVLEYDSLLRDIVPGKFRKVYV